MSLAVLTLALAAICALAEVFGDRANFHLTQDDLDQIDFGR